MGSISIYINSAQCINPTFKEWQLAVQQQFEERDNIGWRIADLLIYGERAFGDRFSQVLDDMRMNHHTVENLLWIGKKFPKDRRRPAPLTRSHHEAVAGLNEADQEVWLDEAMKARLSVQDLREAVKAARSRRQETLSAEEIYETCPQCHGRGKVKIDRVKRGKVA